MRVISGTARGTKLNSIDSLATRPTLDRVKESLFNIIRDKIEDSTVLDLFAGSGAIGIEFLSRGAKEAVFCEKSHQATHMIYKNIERAIKLKPEFMEYINIINGGEEQERNLDLNSINLLLENHSIDMVYDFMPRYLELE